MILSNVGILIMIRNNISGIFTKNKSFFSEDQICQPSDDLNVNLSLWQAPRQFLLNNFILQFYTFSDLNISFIWSGGKGGCMPTYFINSSEIQVCNKGWTYLSNILWNIPAPLQATRVVNNRPTLKSVPCQQMYYIIIVATLLV